MTDQTYSELQEPIILADKISFEDYLVQFEGQHTEWHVGKVLQKVSNNERHQLILGFLYRLVMDFLEIKGLGTAMAGFPMYISPNVPAREPDLMVILNDKLDKVTATYLDGPADIAVEVVSPGSYNDDRVVKLFEYEKVGVREYWFIDPIRKDATIYVLNTDGRYERYPEDDSKRLRSSILEGFVLPPTILWQEQLPTRLEINRLLDEMID